MGEGRGAGWITEVPRASVSFLFIYSPCLFFFLLIYSPRPPPPPFFFPHLQHTFTLPSFTPPTASFSFLPSLCLPREKRFCLLLVSAPSQSAFLISSYCFCLIFKCYPRPNGNPYTHTHTKQAERGEEGETGWVLCFTPGP